MIIIYEVATGKILRNISCPEFLVESQIGVGEAYIEGGANDVIRYVLNEAPTDRPTMPLVITGLIISGIPVGTMVTSEGVSAVVDDGVAELQFDQIGIFPVTLTCFPYLDAEVLIENLN